MLSVIDRGELPGPRGRRPEGDYFLDAEEYGRGPLIAPQLARGIVATVFVGICGVAYIFVLHSDTTVAQRLLAAAYLVALLALQVGYFSRASTRLRSPLTYLALVVQAILVFAPLPEFGQSWVGMPSLLAGTALLVLPAFAAWTAFAAIVVVVAWTQTMLTGWNLGVVYLALGIVVAALEVYGLTRLARVITDLHDARAELGKAAVAQERMRFARDLHDLLGLSLSTIGPKGAIARRAVADEPERARQELAEILSVSRHALADVRLLASGYREQSLHEESRTVQSLLAASNVDVRMELNHSELPVHLRTVLVAVLRTGAANVLRHNDVGRCEITMRQVGEVVSLDMVNDGQVDGPPDDDGFGVLTDRVAALGGELTAGPEPDGGYRLHLTIPVALESTDGPARPGPAELVSRRATYLASGLMDVVFVGFFVAGVLHLLLVTDEPVQLVSSIGYMLALLVLQLGYVSRPDRTLRRPMNYAVLAVQVVLVYLPLVQFGPTWVSIPGFLAGTMLLVLRPIYGWTGFVVVVGTVAWAQSGFVGDPLDIAYYFASTVITGLVTYGLTWMARSVTQLRIARLQLAYAAVADERMRFARDLHDLLGLSLSAITLKSELAHRLLAADPARARKELMEIVAISRLALADVRLVANGYRELSLNEESRSAESVLAAADVEVRMELHYGELPPEVRTVLATVLREGVTNVLRHSKGAHCEITVRQHDKMVLLEIVNDGMVDTPEVLDCPGGGSGIRNLSDRVAKLGGELTAGVTPDGTFRLRASVPA
ncbi:sensor histidine kinase [Actinokineospora sp.]|uniref:sensor histidine kinase n=1 Tax=Actinokineospora sp. TaxID=1872133 RepID=UPI0040378839